jgi:hypothetical protein
MPQEQQAMSATFIGAELRERQRWMPANIVEGYGDGRAVTRERNAAPLGAAKIEGQKKPRTLVSDGARVAGLIAELAGRSEPLPALFLAGHADGCS